MAISLLDHGKPVIPVREVMSCIDIVRLTENSIVDAEKRRCFLASRPKVDTDRT